MDVYFKRAWRLHTPVKGPVVQARISEWIINKFVETSK